MRKSETLDITHPEICVEWHPTLNGDKRPSDFTKGSNQKCWWLCKDCLSAYDAKINNKSYHNSKCPYCSGRKVNHTNCLANTHPNLTLEWHEELNGATTPHNVIAGSHTKCWWICPKCFSHYESAISDRTCGGNACPFCAGQKINNTNCLATTHPSLAIEWHPTLNDITPNDITGGSSRKVWWICPNCHSDYQAALRSRTSLESACPYCAGLKVNDTNSFATRYPRLASEWHPSMNGHITPNDIMGGTQKKYWWQCFNCQASYLSTPNGRTAMDNSCPFCSKSKNEKLTGRFLEQLLPHTNIARQYSVRILNHPFRIDYAFDIENQKYFIEYNGRQHYEPVRWSKAMPQQMAEQNFLIQVQRDLLVREYCDKNQISLMEIDGRKYKGYAIEAFLKETLPLS